MVVRMLLAGFLLVWSLMADAEPYSYCTLKSIKKGRHKVPCVAADYARYHPTFFFRGTARIFCPIITFKDRRLWQVRWRYRSKFDLNFTEIHNEQMRPYGKTEFQTYQFKFDRKQRKPFLEMENLTPWDDGYYECQVTTKTKKGGDVVRYPWTIRMVVEIAVPPEFGEIKIKGPQRSHDVFQGESVTLPCSYIAFGGYVTIFWHHRTFGPNVTQPSKRSKDLTFNVTEDTVGRYCCMGTQWLPTYNRNFSDEICTNVTMKYRPTPLLLAKAEENKWFLYVAIGLGFALLKAIVVIFTCFRRRKRATINLVKIPEMCGNTIFHNSHYNFGYRVPIPGSFEIDRDSLVLQEKLGEGYYGVVHRAVYSPERDSPRNVAVKFLKDEARESDFHSFVQELATMTRLGKHCNIVTLLGACTASAPLWIVLELCDRGNLRALLRDARERHEPLPKKSLYQFAHQIAGGMAHLAARKVVHRDLAARNVLLTSDNVVKLCDFGLTRQTGDKEYYQLGDRNVALPIKWMAPESINDGKHSSASDVWSYGIVLWEIFTYGLEPYPRIPNSELQKIYDYLHSGVRCSYFPNIPRKAYGVMNDCWSLCPNLRPSFEKLRKDVAELLNDCLEESYLTVIHHEVARRTPELLNPDSASDSQYYSASTSEESGYVAASPTDDEALAPLLVAESRCTRDNQDYLLPRATTDDVTKTDQVVMYSNVAEKDGFFDVNFEPLNNVLYFLNEKGAVDKIQSPLKDNLQADSSVTSRPSCPRYVPDPVFTRSRLASSSEPDLRPSDGHLFGRSTSTVALIGGKGKVATDLNGNVMRSFV